MKYRLLRYELIDDRCDINADYCSECSQMSCDLAALNTSNYLQSIPQIFPFDFEIVPTWRNISLGNALRQETRSIAA